MTSDVSTRATDEEPDPEAPTGKKRSLTRNLVEGAISVSIVVGIFAFAIPKVADYSAVGSSATPWSSVASIVS